jgi:hypothetical protein
MCKIAEPVLDALSHRRLKERMPVEAHSDGRRSYTYLEALGRTLAGISCWLEAGIRKGEEEFLRKRFAELARTSIDAATDPQSPDFMNFSEGGQPIVDAAFLAHAIVRAPTELWSKLDGRTKLNLVSALKLTRTRKPGYNNWLLFSAMIETALYRMGEPDWDPMRIDYALKQHDLWYKGDGIYGDGPEFHWDYYNSFVIQPMLLDILSAVGSKYKEWSDMYAKVVQRARRYAVVQERMISPEGTFPALGRSLAYRFGAFQLLAQVVLRNELPPALHPAQVRCALTAVIRRMIEAPGTFDENGWLRIGFCGHQPELGEEYISTGSLYLCLTVFLPLGLPEDHPFWQGEEDWSSKKIWSGGQVPIDKAFSEKI